MFTTVLIGTRFAAVVLLIGSVCAELSFGAQSSLDQAQDLLAKGSLKEGVAMLRQIVEKEPNNSKAHLLLGSALAVQGIRGESIEQMTVAVRLSPNSANAYNRLGMVLSRFLESHAARKAFERAVELDPNLAEARINLSLILAQDGEFPAAQQQLDSAIKLESDSKAAAYAYYVRAKVWSARGDNEKSIADLEKATQLRPDYSDAWSDLAELRYSKSDYSGAVKAAEKVVEISPNDPAAQYRLGHLYLEGENAPEALKHLKSAQSLGADDKATLYALARALRMTGHFEEAQQVEKRVIELQRQSVNATEVGLTASGLNDEGIRLEKSGDVQAALAKYRAALDLDPTGYGFRLNYGLALCRMGNWQDGIVQLRQVLKADPDNADAAKALYIAEEQAAKAKQ